MVKLIHEKQINSYKGSEAGIAIENIRTNALHEFEYKTYWRLLERIQGGSTVEFEFQKNQYSTYQNRTHFTPIWMPDGGYTVNTWVIDAWTPVGMLSRNLTDSLIIKGSLWDDWHIAPLGE